LVSHSVERATYHAVDVGREVREIKVAVVIDEHVVSFPLSPVP